MVPERQRAEGNLDFDGFIDVVYSLLNAVLGEGWGVFTQKKPTFTEDERNIDMPQILYSLERIRPGQVGKGIVERTPRHRETRPYVDEDGNRSLIETRGRIIDCSVSFIIYATSNREANNLTNRLRNILDVYKGVLLEKGIQNIWFEEENQRSDRENLKDPVASRELKYLVRLEELTHINVSEIKSVSVQVNIMKEKLGMEGKLPSQSKE